MILSLFTTTPFFSAKRVTSRSGCTLKLKIGAFDSCAILTSDALGGPTPDLIGSMIKRCCDSSAIASSAPSTAASVPSASLRIMMGMRMGSASPSTVPSSRWWRSSSSPNRFSIFFLSIAVLTFMTCRSPSASTLRGGRVDVWRLVAFWMAIRLSTISFARSSESTQRIESPALGGDLRPVIRTGCDGPAVFICLLLTSFKSLTRP
mmetsp:Transcript_19280/g.28276  ORF Transcript_19280/g.28276 Transcript_19280/m.28276 type:complete len:206 (-) Transcript_19280:107-724(-)